MNDFEQNYLNGLEGFGKKLKRKLRKIAKSKVFKAALVVGAGAVAYNYAGPALKAGLSKHSSKLKKVGKKLLNKGGQIIQDKLAAPAKTPAPLQAPVNQAVYQAQQLPPDEREQALYSNPALMADSAYKASMAVRPMIQDEYLNQGYSYESAQEMAKQDAHEIGKEVTQNFVETAPGNGAGGLMLPAAVIAALTFMG